MEEYINGNPIYLRSCILFEVASNKPIFDCYKSFCKKLGEDAMTYEEFNFWFMKFSRGEMDLGYDRSKDLQTRNFSNLPVKILNDIVQEVAPKDVMTLRQVSKDLNNAMNEIQVRYKSAYLRLRYKGFTLKINGEKIVGEEGNVWDSGHIYNVETDKWYLFRKIEEMYPYLKYPNIHFENFHLECHKSLKRHSLETWLYDQFRKFLKVISHHVTSVKLRQADDNLEILEILQPGTLREFHLMEYEIFDVIQLNEFYNDVINTEQWKQAKVFRCEGNMEWAKIEELSHFEDFQIRNWLRKDDDWEKLMNIIRTNLLFRKCCLMRTESHQYGLFTPNERASLKSAFGRRIKKLPSDSTHHRFLWMDGTKEFEIEMCDELIKIKRIN